MKLKNYIFDKVYGLPKPKHRSTSYNNKLGYEYVHKIKMGSKFYYKVHIGRTAGNQYKSKIKYFKTLEEAVLFTEFLRENKYI